MLYLSGGPLKERGSGNPCLYEPHELRPLGPLMFQTHPAVKVSQPQNGEERYGTHGCPELCSLHEDNVKGSLVFACLDLNLEYPASS